MKKISISIGSSIIILFSIFGFTNILSNTTKWASIMLAAGISILVNIINVSVFVNMGVFYRLFSKTLLLFIMKFKDINIFHRNYSGKQERKEQFTLFSLISPCT
ncbi:hypothetical protein [Bacillus sp. SG-1]|uniref:hypothetical protein n=1 Tax=Bacillus sp. SG-1 TaxID=161544 RepID=UPI00015441E2|nr:hypothetical protein [Bacillus sp. SG-1]EDL66625.1 hypothetical protein BSG1_04695 [Bacillus sp. SG-1]